MFRFSRNFTIQRLWISEYIKNILGFGLKDDEDELLKLGFVQNFMGNIFIFVVNFYIISFVSKKISFDVPIQSFVSYKI